MPTKKELEERICRLEAKIFYMEKDLAGVKYQAEDEEGIKEPDYIQVGDQWRDEEGNEYVLSSCKIGVFHHFGDCAGSNTRFKALLINKETGSTINATRPEIFLNHGFLENNELTKAQLGITDSMTKIK